MYLARASRLEVREVIVGLRGGKAGECSGWQSPASPIGSLSEGRSYPITAEVEVPKGGAEGVLNTTGGRFGGYGLYLLKGRPEFTYNLADFVWFRWENEGPLTPGKHTVSFEFTYDGPGLGKGGTGVLKADGEPVATKKVPHTLASTTPWDETFDVGSDTGTPVGDLD